MPFRGEIVILFQELNTIETHFHLPDMPHLTNRKTARKLTAAAFIFFLAKGMLWLVAAAGLTLAAQ